MKKNEQQLCSWKTNVRFYDVWSDVLPIFIEHGAMTSFMKVMYDICTMQNTYEETPYSWKNQRATSALPCFFTFFFNNSSFLSFFSTILTEHRSPCLLQFYSLTSCSLFCNIIIIQLRLHNTSHTEICSIQFFNLIQFFFFFILW